MKIVITQPHFFPWVGYFDKMAKVDQFIFLDMVQLEKASQMLRNRVISPGGTVKYLTISADKSGHYERKYNEIQTVDNSVWKAKHLSMLREYYRKTVSFPEVFSLINEFYQNNYRTVCEWAISSVQMVRGLLGIPTQLVFQSELEYDRTKKRSDLILELCIVAGANTYFSGRGASVDYLDREKFRDAGVKIVFQDFSHPVYPQCNTKEFVPGISILDMLFNCGIEETRRIFWENVRRTHEFDEQ